MAIGGLSHSTVPTYFDERSDKLNGLALNQILICQSYLGEHRNFIVVDAVSIDASNHNVETCYNNGWIIDFPGSAVGNKEMYKIVLTGAEYDVNQAGIQVGKLLLRNQSLFTVSINGIEVAVADWYFLTPKPSQYHAGLPEYVSSIMLSNAIAAGLLGTDLIEIEYIENITLGGDYNIKLYRSDGQSPRPYMIPKSGGFNGRVHFLGDATEINKWTWDTIYYRLDESSNVTAQKRQCDLARIAEFATDLDLVPFGLKIEVYAMGRFNNDGQAWSTRSSGTSMRLVYSTTDNVIDFSKFNGNGPANNKVNGVYGVRVVDLNNAGASPILNTKISIKSFPVCVTNPSLSLNNCVGYYQTSKLV